MPERDSSPYKFARNLSWPSPSMVGRACALVENSCDPAVVPELLVSFYGWDSKHFLVGSHERDANVAACTGRFGGPNVVNHEQVQRRRPTFVALHAALECGASNHVLEYVLDERPEQVEQNRHQH